MAKCQCKVYDINEDTYRCCKNNKKFTVYLNKPVKYCHRHAIIHINKFCIIIQKHYKAYRTRNKIKLLFINLPDDLQKKVLFYIREPLYLTKIYQKISSIICPKINMFLEDIDHEVIFFYREASLYHYLSPDQVGTFCYLLNLTFKYHSILPKDLRKELYNVTNTLHINYILCDVENTVYKNEWSCLIRHFNQLKTLKRK
jgi:hypothetical protein